MNFLDLISILAGFLCLQTLVQLQRNWVSFWNAHVTARDQAIAQRLAIFLLLPLTVPLHELGHCLATWQVGGTVADFQWRFFWGFMIPVGKFTPVEFWWISLSGNLVSIALGLLALLLIPVMRQRIWAELLYHFVCANSINSLVIYPAVAVSGGGGDWATIYDFKVQPYSWLFLVGHLGLLWWLSRLYSSPMAVKWRLARNLGTLMAWEKLQANGQERSQDIGVNMAKFNFLIRHQEERAAYKIAKTIQAAQPEDPSVRLLGVAIAHSKHFPRQVIKLGQRLLDVEMSPIDRLNLYRYLCIAHMSFSQWNLAQKYLDLALAIEPDNYLLNWHRAELHLAQKQPQAAEQVMQIVLQNAPDEELRQEIQDWVRQKIHKFQIF
jgi:hypothetical protein